MIKKLSTATLVLLLSMSSLYAGKGKIRVASNHEGAYVYVDGKKKAMTGEGFSSILLEEGEYTIRVEKLAPDGKHAYVAKKRVFVGEDSSTKLSFKLKRKLTSKGEAYEQYKRQRWVRDGSVVIDKELGLMWQDNKAAKTLKKKWKAAKKYCSNLILAGHSDWRLPSYDELLSIVDYDRYDPAIIPSFEHVNTSDYYWSSSVYVSSTKDAWIVYFKYGYTNNYDKANEYYVRCVRGRQ